MKTRILRADFTDGGVPCWPKLEWDFKPSTGFGEAIKLNRVLVIELPDGMTKAEAIDSLSITQHRPKKRRKSGLKP